MTVEDVNGGAGDMPITVAMGGPLEEFKEVEEVKKLIGNIVNIYKDDIAVELTCERMQNIFGSYQEQAHLLDPYLESLLKQLLEIVRDPDVPTVVLHLAFKLLYLITKTRGYKVIVRMMPHEVSDLEPLLALLALQSPSDFENWETRYILLLWLSIVCMIPFDMARFDGHLTTADGEGRKTVTQRIIDSGMLYLCVCDKSRDAAAYMLSKFLTRPDVKQQKLPEFLDWALIALKAADVTTMTGTIKLVGVVNTMALLFKHGKREDLVDHANAVLEHVIELKTKVNQNTVLAKLCMKLTQRLGLTFLKAKVTTWRYQRGHRSLAANLAQSTSGGDAEGPSRDLGSKETTAPSHEEEDEDYDIREEVEEVIEQLLNGLKHNDTIVRWSAAKGIGRLTGRLPQELADEVVGSIMQLFTIVETDGAWHGGCLAMAELGRRGLLLPARLVDVVPVIIKALNFDEKRGNFSVGAHVRDAACYVCWSFARAYDPDQLKPYVNEISSALVIVSIFDREVNVRRAAAAAFQENVGRQGQFPHGIDILTTCDYFTVGNRTHCYTELSVYVGQFSEYTLVLIDHLVHVKIAHWDSNIRELSAEGLHCLTANAPQYMAKEVLPLLVGKCLDMDLTVRHGAILATASVTHALAEQAWTHGKVVADTLDEFTVDNLRNIIPKLHEAKLFRGLGGELMRKATCCLIHKLSLARMPFHNDTIIDVWQNLLNDCVQNLDPDIQELATVALSAFVCEYYRQSDGHPKPQAQESLIAKYLKALSSSEQTTRIGFALAFGAMPKFMLEGRVQEVVSCLVTASRLTKKEEKWVESRRCAIKALTSLYKTEPDEPSRYMDDILCADTVNVVYDALFTAGKDYTLDSRGDVGAGVREACMTGLLQVTSTLTKAQPSLITPDICRQLFCCVVQQAVEKIDRTRAHAGQVFTQLLHHSPPIPHVPHRDDLLRIFPRTVVDRVNWLAPTSTFPLFTQLLALPTYTYNALLGLTVSVGGLTESLVKYSAAALLQYLSRLSNDKHATEVFSEVVLQILRDHRRVDRVTLPMFKMLDQLLANGCFEILVDGDISFPQTLLTLSRDEIQKCGETQKLLASINVFCGLLHFTGKVRTNTLSQLFRLLCHRFPIVRRTTASSLYESVVMYDDLVDEDGQEKTLTLLSDTQWDHPLEEVRVIRNELCDLMKVPRPVLKTASMPNMRNPGLKRSELTRTK